MFASRLIVRWAAVWVAVWGGVLALVMTAPPPATDTLSYLADTGNGRETWLYALDARRGLSIPLVSGPGVDVRAYSWSPDGRQLAYVLPPVVSSSPELGRLIVRGADGTRRTLTDVAPANTPLWTADSSRIVFGGTPNMLIIVNAATGTRSELWLRDMGYVRLSSYVALQDNDILLQGQTTDSSGPPAYYRFSLTTGRIVAHETIPCSDRTPRDLSHSPDGTRIIFGCGDAQVLFLANIDTPEDREVFAPMQEMGELGTEAHPRWSADGTQVLFRHYPMFIQPNQRPYNTYIADLTSGEVRRLPLPREIRATEWLPVEALGGR